MGTLPVGSFERSFEDELALALLRVARLRAAQHPPRPAAEASAAAPVSSRRGTHGSGGAVDDVTDSRRLGRRF